MTHTVSITSQGQISIPASFRKKLGLSKNTKAFITEREGKLIIEPVKDFLQMRGSIKTNKRPLLNKEMHDFVAKAVTDDYSRKLKKKR